MENVNDQLSFITLQNVVDTLIDKLSPVAANNNSSVVNDIPAKIHLTGDSYKITSVIAGLLRSVINNARESRIHVSAKELYGKIMMLSVKDINSANAYEVACGLQEVVPLAEKIGGQLNIISERQSVTTVALQFPIG